MTLIKREKLKTNIYWKDLTHTKKLGNLRNIDLQLASSSLDHEALMVYFQTNSET